MLPFSIIDLVFPWSLTREASSQSFNQGFDSFLELVMVDFVSRIPGYRTVDSVNRPVLFCTPGYKRIATQLPY
jgi:hypothetical protein